MDVILRYIPDWAQRFLSFSITLLIIGPVFSKVLGDHIDDVIERRRHRKAVMQRYLRRKAYRESQEVR